MNTFSSENGDGLPDNEIGKLQFSRTQSYFDKSIVIRFLIGGIFAIVLFFFLHFRETYVETLELGTDARRYVVAQIDFAFPDEEATIILRQKAAHEIGNIWRVEEDQIQEKEIEFLNFINKEGEGNTDWEKLAHDNDFEDAALVISLLIDAFSQSRFSDAKTVEKIEHLPQNELPIASRYFYSFLPASGSIRLPVQFWSHMAKMAFEGQQIPQPILSFVVNYFEPLIWDFEKDVGIEHSLRLIAQSHVPEIYSRVRAGERLVDQGEKVQLRHIAMLQAMKEKLNQKRNLLDPATLAGSFLMTLIFIAIMSIFLKENHRDIFYSNRKLALLVTILSLSLLLAKAVELLLLKNTFHLIDAVQFPLFIPFTAILLACLMNIRIAAFATIFLGVVYSMALAVESVPFLVINILTAIVAIMTGRSLGRRKDIFMVCGKAWIASLLVILAFNLYENTAFSLSFLSDLLTTFLFMLVTAIVVVGLLPLLESTFHIMTDITLMEYMDPSNELLRRLTIEAPGTYQHSMVVGHLAESAASSIGANGLFCRVATQYHDIGKLINPQYFTENQMGGIDMHQLLTPVESAQVIIAHVSEGVALARKMGLPEQFIDIIKEHHGTTLVYYFYHKQAELMGGDKNKIESHNFRYSGPRPRSKESTIIMIADTLEAASRSLDLFNATTVTCLVDQLIAHKMEDGQFDNSLLTFEELGIIKQTLIKTLLAASHPRIKYPPHHPGEEG